MQLSTLACLTIYGIRVFAADATPDEQAVEQVVEQFRNVAAHSDPDQKIAGLLADDYVHITPDGAMTTSWRLARDSVVPGSVTMNKLHIRVFGDLAVASYRWRSTVAGAEKTTSVIQVFRKQQGAWRAIATQAGGRDPGFLGPMAAAGMTAPRNPAGREDEVRGTWDRYTAAADMRTPAGDRAEDMDTIRSILAEDCLFVQPNGDPVPRDQRLAQGHPKTVQLTGNQKAGAVSANSFKHTDVHLAVSGNAAIWTSRNPGNGDQSVRVFLKRPAGWQMVVVRHGMSFRKNN